MGAQHLRREMATRRLRALSRALASGSQLAAKALVPVVTADDVLDEPPAEMSDTEKFLWDLQGVSPIATPVVCLAGC